VLARAGQVVLANAAGAMALLQSLQTSQTALDVRANRLPVMHGVRGLLSWSLHTGTPDAAFPPHPFNGAGSVVPAVPVEEAGRAAVAWYVGSSYQPASQPESPDAKNHAANLGRLHRLLPNLGQALQSQFSNGTVRAWKSTRCVTSDRLPVVGPLDGADRPGLWISAGMGSRGLSFAMLCAELLAARWAAEPLPVEAALAQSLRALRAAGASAVPV
jgi:tRNA 5-methylaminomethyl-2-thiouridine biosynthesis bifunctional protein